MGDHERRALDPGRTWVTAQRHGKGGEPFTNPGAAARLAEHGPAIKGVLRACRVVGEDQQVRDGGGAEQRLVPAGGK